MNIGFVVAGLDFVFRVACVSGRDSFLFFVSGLGLVWVLVLTAWLLDSGCLSFVICYVVLVLLVLCRVFVYRRD
jgi:hypothetical protein